MGVEVKEISGPEALDVPEGCIGIVIVYPTVFEPWLNGCISVAAPSFMATVLGLLGVSWADMNEVMGRTKLFMVPQQRDDWNLLTFWDRAECVADMIASQGMMNSAIYGAFMTLMTMSSIAEAERPAAGGGISA